MDGDKMTNNLDLDFRTVSRYIQSSYLPSHYEICKRVLTNYERRNPLDIYGIADLRLQLEDKITGEYK